MKWFRSNLKDKENTSPMQETMTKGLLIFDHLTTVMSVEELLKMRAMI